MSAFLLALVATLLASTGGRDQRLVAQLSERLSAPVPLLVAATVSAAVAAMIAAAFGEALALLLPSAAKTMLVAFALILGAIELAWPILQREPAEPTRSVFAVILVIVARQIGDGPRFLILAIAAAYGSPWMAGAGGALGGVAALVVGWALGGQLYAKWPLRAIRLAIAAVLFLAGIYSALFARGII